MSELHATEHFDVIIVGAGISGIDAAYHLRRDFPEKSFVILEALESFGGTWLVHTYPGVRSDSDLYTFGYEFKPWTGAPIATADEILTYLGEVIEENDLARDIRYQHTISTASFDSASATWTVHGTVGDDARPLTLSANFLWMCQGYYRHAEGYTPEWPGMETYEGRIIHPQTWPEDADIEGKNVIVIGSGATAATLVPAIAGTCAHVTVVQRSPTYFWPSPNTNEVADMLRQLDIPEEWTHEIVRRKILFDQELVTQLSFQEPEFVRDELLNMIRPLLPEGYDIDKHFTPKYMPWRQRLARVPDGDLFTGIREGLATMVTDEIETFTPTGLVTKDGTVLEADVIITATGFNLSVLGDIAFDVDGEPVSWPDTVTYRGAMFTGVPNMAWVFGYFRASWTLRADLVSAFLMRLFHFMDENDFRTVTPQLRDVDADMPILDWVNVDDFNPGYLLRSMHLMPKRGDKSEWQHSQDYWTEKKIFPEATFDDGCLQFH